MIGEGFDQATDEAKKKLSEGNRQEASPNFVKTTKTDRLRRF
jgi:hypothetical protein